MTPAYSVTLCTAIFLATKAAAFLTLKDILAPDDLKIIRVRTPEEARAMGPFAVLDFVGLAQRYNYPAEEHKITTKDGYNLALHRIPGSSVISNSTKKKAVLVQHGILATSDCWILRGPNEDIPFLLADAGYDVWVGNLRGNSYGRSHQYLSPSDPKFWEYSFHEHGIHDMKTMVDYILNYTNNQQMYYIGHSMGTTLSYVLLSELPEYNQKFNLVISLSPIAYWNHGLSPTYQFLVKNSGLIMNFLLTNKIYEIGSHNFISRFIGTSLCKESIWQPLCAAGIFLFSGNDPMQLNMTFLPYIFSYYPAGTSYQTLHHYLQNMLSAKFQAYDYGETMNWKRYRQILPPEYDLSKISAKVAIFYGRGDAVATSQNVEELYKRLNNVVMYQEIPYPWFNHLDFMWGSYARAMLYDKIIEMMKNY